MALAENTYGASAWPADVWAFCGQGFESRVIGLWTTTLRQKWNGQLFSHVGIASELRGEMKLFESTTLNDLACDVAHRMVKGVQCHDIDERVASYNGRVYLLRLQPRERLTPFASKRLSGFLADCLGRPYDVRQAVLAGTHYTKHWFDPDATKLFCDEMVAMALFDCWKLDRTFNPSAITPAWLVNHLVSIGLYTMTRIK